MKSEFLDLEKKRRTVYALGKNVDFSNEEIADLVKNVVKEAPTAFNSQSTRAVIAFGKSHEQVWEIVKKNLKKVMNDDEAFAKTEQKINAFEGAYATVLWFTDMDVVHGLEKQFPAYADNFYDWSEQAMGNANFAVWTALAENGLGANLQHYNPLIDDDIQKEFDKEYMDDDKRFKVVD